MGKCFVSNFRCKISGHLNRTQETKMNCDEETCKKNDDQKSFKEIENIPQDSKLNHNTVEEKRGGKFPKIYISFNKSKSAKAQIAYLEL